MMGSLIIKNYCIGEREAKMQAVGLEPTRANTLRPERSTLDHSVTLASDCVPFVTSIYFTTVICVDNDGKCGCKCVCNMDPGRKC